MSTSIAISTMAVTQSSIAAGQAAAANKVACQSYMQTFDAKTATVASMQQYADCVNIVHPNDMDPSVVIALKVAVVVILISTAIGAFRPDAYDRALGGLGGFLLGLCGCMAAGAIWWVLA